MLDQETRLYHYDDILDSSYLSSRMAATKPHTSLLLVSSQFSSEYRKRCEGRWGLFVSEKLENLNQWTGDLVIPQKVAENATFMHIHAGQWCDPSEHFASHMGLASFSGWLSHCISQMPKLQSVSINLYTNKQKVSDPKIRADLVRDLGSLTSVDQVNELRLIVMEEPQGWLLWRSKHAVKTLLAHWERGRDVSPQVMHPRVSYEEKCCEESLVSGLVKYCKGEEDGDYLPDCDSDHSEDSGTKERGSFEICLGNRTNSARRCSVSTPKTNRCARVIHSKRRANAATLFYADATRPFWLRWRAEMGTKIRPSLDYSLPRTQNADIHLT
jgi:hypothetical protein